MFHPPALAFDRLVTHQQLVKSASSAIIKNQILIFLKYFSPKIFQPVDICANPITIDQLTTGSSNFLRPCPWEELILGEGSDEANRQLCLFQIIFSSKKWEGNLWFIVGVLIGCIYFG